MKTVTKIYLRLSDAQSKNLIGYVADTFGTLTKDTRKAKLYPVSDMYPIDYWISLMNKQLDVIFDPNRNADSISEYLFASVYTRHYLDLKRNRIVVDHITTTK